MDVTKCAQCGGELTQKQTRRFQAKAKHQKKSTGRMPDGPFCGNVCRAEWMAKLAATRFQRMTTTKGDDVAYRWAVQYVDSQEDIDFQGVFEGMTDVEWNAHFEFIKQCFAADLKPTHFLDVLITHPRRINDFLDA